MSVAVITPPESGLITLEDAKQHLRVECCDFDDLIQMLVFAASGAIEGPYGWLSRAITTQTLEWTGDEFYCEAAYPRGHIPLPCPPVQSITSVKYTDSVGDEQTLDPSTYRLSGNSLTLATGQSWPTIADETGSVRVRYVAGFGDIDAVPYPIRAAALLMVGHLWQNREAVSETQTFEVPLALQSLLSPYRVMAL